MSARDRSPRPAEILPCTLLPNPVALAAPRPERLASLLVASVLYCAMGAAVLGGARHLEARGHGRIITCRFGPIEDEPPQPVARPYQPPVGRLRPEGFKAVVPKWDDNAMPVGTPDHVSTEDHSHEVVGTTDVSEQPFVPGAPVPTGPVTDNTLPQRGTGPVEVDMTQIKVLSQVAPVYPPLARLARAQGAVELRLTIDVRGVPTDVQVLSGPHPLLINEAMRVARLWRFQPAMVDGTAVAATFRLTVGFRLER